MAYYKIEKDIDEVCRITGVREYVHVYVHEYYDTTVGAHGMTMGALIMQKQAEGFANSGCRDLDRLVSLIEYSQKQDQLWMPMYTSANFLSKTIED